MHFWVSENRWAAEASKKKTFDGGSLFKVSQQIYSFKNHPESEFMIQKRSNRQKYLVRLKQETLAKP